MVTEQLYYRCHRNYIYFNMFYVGGDDKCRMKRTSGALITSVVLHLAIAFVTGIYLMTQTPRLPRTHKMLTCSNSKYHSGPKVRKPIVKSVIKPTVPTRNTVVVEQVQMQPRVTTMFVEKTVFQPRTVLEISKQTIQGQSAD